MLIPSQQRTVKRSSGYSHVYHFMHLSLASSQSPESACCLQNEQQSTINNTWGFLDGSVVEPTCQCRRRRFDPWLGKIPHAKCLSLCAAAINACPQEPGSCNHWPHMLKPLKPSLPGGHVTEQEKPPSWEEVQLQMSPCSPPPEKGPCSKDPAQQK